MTYNNKSGGPLKITEASYNRQNPRRVSFACRFGSMQGDMKDKNGTPSKLSKALKKWGFGSKEAARNFCRTHRKS